MKILPLEFKRSDKRGSLIQVISSPGWQQLNHLKINKDNTFGGHYHKERTDADMGGLKKLLEESLKKKE